MRPDSISPSFAERTDTPKVVGSLNEVLAQFIGLLLVIGFVGTYFWPVALTIAARVGGGSAGAARADR
jgi:hypothetical protein